MPIPKYRASRDANEAAIVAALRAVGCDVEPLSKQGVPDLLVYAPHLDRYFLMEIKTTSGKLTQDQVEFHGRWNGPIHIIRSVDDALMAIERV